MARAVQIDFDKFLTALSKVAEKKGQSLPEVVRGVLLAGGPTVNSTKAHYIKFHDDKVSPWPECWVQDRQHGSLVQQPHAA